MLRIPACILFAVLLFACNTPGDSDGTSTSESLQQASLSGAFADNFRIGAAISGSQLRGGDDEALDLIIRECNTITPENDLKWENIHPTRDSFNWGPADTYVAFGEDNDMFTVGHTLVWHSQVAGYVEKVTDPAEMREVLREHINAVAGRYAGRIDAWDVLNEAVNDDGTMRSWAVYDVLGEDFVAEVFKMARAAAPDAELYYNDYNLWMPAKRDGVIRMVKKAMAAGAPIDGIGMQGHYSLNEPGTDLIEESIAAYAELGVKVMFTEVDVTVLPNPWRNLTADPRITSENTPYMNPYPTGLPDSVSTALADRYGDLFSLFLKHSDKVDRVTFWGIYDGSTWLNNWPIEGRTNYPMLFDRDYAKKEAYHRVMKLKEREEGK